MDNLEQKCSYCQEMINWQAVKNINSHFRIIAPKMEQDYETEMKNKQLCFKCLCFGASDLL